MNSVRIQMLAHSLRGTGLNACSARDVHVKNTRGESNAKRKNEYKDKNPPQGGAAFRVELAGV